MTRKPTYEELKQKVKELEKEAAERKKAKQAVQEVREYAESIVDTVREPLVLLDTDLRVISASRSFYQAFQVIPEETKGQLLYNLGNRQWDIPKLRELLEQILPKNSVFDDFEVEHDFATLGRRTMLLNARRLYREANQPRLILLAIEDTTERKRAEEKLREYREHLKKLVEERTAELAKTNEILESEIAEHKQAEEELKKHRDHLEEMVEERTKELRDAQQDLIRSERLATLGQFSGSISHELRNPLGVIDSSAYYLKTKLKNADKKVQEHLDRIKSSVGHATAIIQSVLDLTRMNKQKLEKLDLMPIVSETIATSMVPATVTVVRDFQEAEVLVNADRKQFRLAFNNMVKNAVDAMHGKGSLSVAVRSTAGGKAEVSFADTGPGITPENLDKIFQPLFSTKAKGIGFGLSIAKMIVDKHGGTIEAKSDLGKGATITIELPLYVKKK